MTNPVALFRALKQWWDADTGGWPTAIAVLGLVAFFRLVVLP